MAKGDVPATSARRVRDRKKSNTKLWAFIWVNGLLLGGGIWFYMQPQHVKDNVLGLFGEGWEGRAVRAGICVVLLFTLAKLVLPGIYGTKGGLERLLARMQARKKFLRIVLYPFEIVVWLFWFSFWILFALDAVLIIATSILLMLLVVRIVNPNFMADFSEKYPWLMG